MQSTSTLSRLGIALALAGALAVGPTPLAAGENEARPKQISTRTVMLQPGKRVTFDWLAPRGKALRPTLAAEVRPARQIGSGSWICSPAGFGKKSRCYSN